MEKLADRGLIVAVDDDPDLLSWMKVVLEGAGHSFVGLESGTKAVQEVTARQPKVVLMDLHLPEISGLELCERLQEARETQLIPVVFLTSAGGDLERAKAFRAGAADFLTKPISPEALVAKVDACLQTQQVWDAFSTQKSVKPVAPEAASAAARWDSKVNPTEFARFKQQLISGGGAPARFASVGAGELYEQAGKLGLQPKTVAEGISAFLNIPFSGSPEGIEIRLGVLPTPFCRSHHIVPLVSAKGELKFLLANPFHLEVQDALRRACPGTKGPDLVIAEPGTIGQILVPKGVPPGKRRLDFNTLEMKLKEEYEPEAPVQSVVADHANEESAPIIQLVNSIIDVAYSRGASDIHFEPAQDEVIVRYRIDGDLQVVHRLKPAKLCLPLIARLKIMAELDITEKRLPQDGRIGFRKHSQSGKDFDLRVSTMPVQYGEKCVLRILDKSKAVLPLPDLGFSTRNLEVYRERIRSPYGMVLHVGPTGAGKSMSLYAALNEVKNPSINIQTAEDPVEYTLPGISQTQMNPEIGLTFNRALRGFLRLDPDVILVGEIRDQETAHIAIEAALTGHLLLSTLHTNDAASTILRFVEMGVEPYLVSASLIAICAQRLVRRLCTACRVAYTPDPLQARFVGIPEGQTTTLYRAGGCAKCNRSGYRGRIGVHELLPVDDTLRQEINRKGCTTERLQQVAVKDCGMTTLFWDAMEKVRAGLASVDDVLMNVRADDFDSRPAWMRT